jgi:hypothetical protein
MPWKFTIPEEKLGKSVELPVSDNGVMELDIRKLGD